MPPVAVGVLLKALVARLAVVALADVVLAVSGVVSENGNVHPRCRVPVRVVVALLRALIATAIAVGVLAGVLGGADAVPVGAQLLVSCEKT